MEKIIILFSGIMFIAAGFAFAVAKSDFKAKEKDNKRFGPLNNFNMGILYLLLQNKYLKCLFVALFLILGAVFIFYGLNTDF